MKKLNLLKLFSCLMLVFSVVGGGTHLAFANVTAADARSAGTMQAMEGFLLNVKERWEGLSNVDEHSEYRDTLRTDDGVWKSGDIYIIQVNQNITGFLELKAGEAVRFHAEHPASTDGSLRGIPIFKQLMDNVQGANGGAVCLPDNRTGREGRHVCAVEISYTLVQQGIPSVNNYILVAGFDHEEDDVSFDLIQCPELPEGYFGQTGTDSNGEQFTRTSADMVTDRDSLVNYLKTVAELMTNEAMRIQQGLLAAAPGIPEARRLGLTGVAISRYRPCWRKAPWKSGDIYFYMMNYTDRLYGIFNGLTPEFKGSTLRLYDSCVDIGQTIFDILNQEGATDGFLTYYWSDPTKPDDVVADDSGNPIRGLSTGTSVKLGYFLETNFGGGDITFDFVLGSGIYLDEEYYVPEGGMCQDIPDDLSEFARGYLGEFPDFMELQKDDDGGCSIASADEGNLKAAGLGFFLIAAVMFFGVFGERRLGGKLRTWKF